jgi:dTDP-4-dehydrorhamnose reductase
MSHRVLLLGGHGKVALYMTPQLLSRSWQVTSVIRNPDHASEIQAKAKGQPGQLDILTRSLDDVTSEKHAQSIIDEAKPDTVVWSAGEQQRRP